MAHPVVTGFGALAVDSRINVPLYLKRKGLTETSGLLSVVCFTLNSISFSALVSKTVTERSAPKSLVLPEEASSDCSRLLAGFRSDPLFASSRAIQSHGL